MIILIITYSIILLLVIMFVAVGAFKPASKQEDEDD